MNSVAADQQECTELILQKRSHRAVTSRTQGDMPIVVQTIEKPVVLNVAPTQILTDKDSEEARKKFKELNAH